MIYPEDKDHSFDPPILNSYFLYTQKRKDGIKLDQSITAFLEYDFQCRGMSDK